MAKSRVSGNVLAKECVMGPKQRNIQGIADLYPLPANAERSVTMYDVRMESSGDSSDLQAYWCGNTNIRAEWHSHCSGIDNRKAVFRCCQPGKPVATSKGS